MSKIFTFVQLQRTVTAAHNFAELRQIDCNRVRLGIDSAPVRKLFDRRGMQLAWDEICGKTSVPVKGLKRFEQATALTACKLISWLYMQGKKANGTLAQLDHRGWQGAVVSCVERREPTKVFRLCEAQGRLDLVYEWIPIRFGNDFETRTREFAQFHLNTSAVASHSHY